MEIKSLMAGEDHKKGDTIYIENGTAFKIQGIPPVTMNEFYDVVLNKSDGCAMESIKRGESGKYMLWRHCSPKAIADK